MCMSGSLWGGPAVSTGRSGAVGCFFACIDVVGADDRDMQRLLSVGLAVFLAASCVAQIRADIRDFGADGTDTLDDSAAFAAAAAAVIAAGKGVVYVPSGRELSPGVFQSFKFYVGSPVSVTIPSGKHLTLAGDARSSSIRALPGALPTMFSFHVSGNARLDVSSLSLDGNASSVSQPAGSRIMSIIGSGAVDAPSEIRVSGCSFIDQVYVSLTIWGSGSYENTRALVDSCSFKGGRSGVNKTGATFDPRYVEIGDGAGVTVTACQFDTLRSGADRSFDPGISGVITTRSGSQEPIPFSKVIVSSCTFRGVGRVAVNSIGCVDLYARTAGAVVSGNRFYDCRYTAIRGKSCAEGVVVANNTVFISNADGIEFTHVATAPLWHSSQSVIEGNVVRSVQRRGIHYDGGDGALARNVSVQGNCVVDAQSSGISVMQVQDVSIVGNVLESVSIETGGVGVTSGIHVKDVAGECVVSTNKVSKIGQTSQAGNLPVAIFVEGRGTTSNVLIADNMVRQSVHGGIVFRDLNYGRVVGNMLRWPGTPSGTALVGVNMDLIMIQSNVNSGYANPLSLTTYSVLKESGNSWNP